MDINIMSYISASEAREKTKKILEKDPITIDQCMLAIEDATKEGKYKVTVQGFRKISVMEELKTLGYTISYHISNDRDMTIGW